MAVKTPRRSSMSWHGSGRRGARPIGRVAKPRSRPDVPCEGDRPSGLWCHRLPIPEVDVVLPACERRGPRRVRPEKVASRLETAAQAEIVLQRGAHRSGYRGTGSDRKRQHRSPRADRLHVTRLPRKDPQTASFRLRSRSPRKAQGSRNVQGTPPLPPMPLAQTPATVLPGWPGDGGALLAFSGPLGRGRAVQCFRSGMSPSRRCSTAAEARRVVEIGALRGETHVLMLDRLGPDAELHVIDPVPDFDPAEHEQRFAGPLPLPPRPQPQRARRPAADGRRPHRRRPQLVHGVPRAAAARARRRADAGAPLPCSILHDVGWPYGRRDLYYDPETIPEEFRQPCGAAGHAPGRTEPARRGAG